MFAIDSILFGLVATLIGFKVGLLAAATVLLVHVLTKRAWKRKLAPAPDPVRYPELDVRV